MMRAISLAGLAVLLVATSVAGETRVVFRDGRSLAVHEARSADGVTRLVLGSGGELRIPESWILRVETSEAVSETPVAPASPRSEAAPSSQVPTQFDDWIDSLSAKHGVEPKLVRAVIQTESGFGAEALSSAGALGLMQLMPATAARFGCTSRIDPVANLDCGTRYLRWLLDRYDGSKELALAAYNAGEGAVDRWGGVPPYPETRAFVRKVLALEGR